MLETKAETTGVLQNMEVLAGITAYQAQKMQTFFSAAKAVQVDADAISNLRQESMIGGRCPMR